MAMAVGSAKRAIRSTRPWRARSDVSPGASDEPCLSVPCRMGPGRRGLQRPRRRGIRHRDVGVTPGGCRKRRHAWHVHQYRADSTATGGQRSRCPGPGSRGGVSRSDAIRADAAGALTGCSGVQFGTSLFSAMLNYRHSDSVAHGASHGVAMVGVHERSNYPLAALTAPIRASPCCGAPTLMLCAPPKVIDLKPVNCVATASMTQR
jgi:hypothetical protein